VGRGPAAKARLPVRVAGAFRAPADHGVCSSTCIWPQTGSAPGPLGFLTSGGWGGYL